MKQTIFFQPFFLIIFPASSLNHFPILFYISFISATISNWIFCISPFTSLNSPFTYFLFHLPLSHFFISLFLITSLFLIFNVILALTKKWSDSVSALLIFLILRTFMQCLLSTNIWFTDYTLSCQVIVRWPCEYPCLVPCYHHSWIPSQWKIYHPFSIIICIVVKAVPSKCWIYMGLFYTFIFEVP